MWIIPNDIDIHGDCVLMSTKELSNDSMEPLGDVE